MIRAIVTDIEGTTSSISFVHEVLFPYAREHMAEYVRRHAEDPAVAPLLNEVRLEAGADLNLDGIIGQLLDWIARDKKITPLKALQGMIWQTGYRQGDFTGHVYGDAVEYLKKWQAQGLRLYVFSSGSVKAQQLLFGFSDAGDLTPLFSGYFDTRIGSKQEMGAYQAIAGAIGLPPSDILFLSDIKQELDAARAAGMQTVWLVRDSEPDATAPHQQVRDFSQIKLQP